MGRRTAKRTGATQADLELSLTTLTPHGIADAEKDLRGVLDLNPTMCGPHYWWSVRMLYLGAGATAMECLRRQFRGVCWR